MPLVPASRLPIAKRLVTIPINGGSIIGLYLAADG